MYTPAHFQIEARDTLHGFMRQHSFATIVSHDGQIPHATHMPVLLNPTQGPHGTLLSHMARANPQWRHFTGAEVLVIFTGPHAYISPAWYVTEPAVPTWNYTVAHAHGVARVVDDPAWMLDLLDRLTHANEAAQPAPWRRADAPPAFIERLMRAIVGIEIPIERLEGKRKASQDEDLQDRQGTVRGLQALGTEAAHGMAALVQGALDEDAAQVPDAG